MKLFERHQKKKPRIEIIPMIDVMLLLLVYYVLSTVAMGHLEGIPVDLPKASTGEAAQHRQDVTLTITKDGAYFFNKDPLNADSLDKDMEAAANRVPGGVQAVQNGTVTINADLAVQHRYVVRGMNALRQLGVSHFGIATEPEGTP